MNENVTIGADQVAVTRTNMLGNCAALRSVEFGVRVGLEGTGFTSQLTGLTINDGSWVSADGSWFGSTDNIVARYKNNYSGAGFKVNKSITYNWSANRYSGRFDTNDNAWWIYDNSTKTLTIGADNNAYDSSKVVQETASQLPWRKLTVVNVVNDVKTVRTQGNITPSTLASWFAYHTSLQTLDLSGMSMSTVSSAADAAAGTNPLFQDMLLGDVNLISITLPSNAYLTNSGLSNATATPTRVAKAGRWLQASNGTEIWFDNSLELEYRYGTKAAMHERYDDTIFNNEDITAASTISHPTNTVTYTWDNSRIGGRFYSNQNVWWYFMGGVLTIGGVTTAGARTRVKEDENYRSGESYKPGIPWFDYGIVSNPRTAISKVVTTGEIQPESMAGWFKGMTGLVSFDGANLNVSQATSMKDLFRGDSNLSSITGMDNWNTGKVWTFSGMFAQLPKITSLSLYMFDTSAAGDFSEMFYNDSNLRTLTLSSPAGGAWDLKTTANRKDPVTGNEIATSDINVKDMYTGLSNISTITVAGNFLFSVGDDTNNQSGFSNTLTNREANKGTWSNSEDRDLPNIWEGSTSNLAGLYKYGQSSSGTAYQITYYWGEGKLLGRFSSNANVWWRYERDANSVAGQAASGKLWIGVANQDELLRGRRAQAFRGATSSRKTAQAATTASVRSRPASPTAWFRSRALRVGSRIIRR